MLYYLTAAGLVAHTLFWGAGISRWVLPREWRRWWWAFAPGFGWALQSAVVWAGSHSSLAGTATYARWSELLPLALLLGVTAGAKRTGGWWPGLRPWTAGVWLVVLMAAGWLLVSPMARPGPGLTASSLGSCDHADYAAGARVFQEFSRDDRTGFLGLPEVTHVRSADYFFDFWLRLNHFTPSALLAHNAAVFGVEAYRLVSVTAAALVLLNLPLVLFLARVTLRLRAGWLVGLVLLYAWSPLNAYAVHHGALGQLYAAQGIGLLTLAVFGASRALRPGPAWHFFALFLAAFWLLAGSYNFILLVGLAPAGAWLALQGVQRRDWKTPGRVATVLAAALGLCAVLFWGRFDGLVERFSLFEQYDFGWAVPLFSPEGWLGILRDPGLRGYAGDWRMVLSLGVAGLWLVGLFFLWRRQRPQALAALAWVLPVIGGWGLLAWETQVRANASYDAYKILAVFLPGLLAGLVCWAAVAGRMSRPVQRLLGVMLGLLLVANLKVALEFRQAMLQPPLRVDRSLAELNRLEAEPRIGSLNLLVEDYWSRLWANAFLLRKAQYFQTHTYEGRLNTALKGEWNLSDSLLVCSPLRPADGLVVNAVYHAERVAAPGLVAASFAEGWYALEKAGVDRWRWSSGRGQVVLNNPGAVTVRANLHLEVRALVPRRLAIELDGRVVATRDLDNSRREIYLSDLRLPPGRTVLTLAAEAAAGTGGDARSLAVALYRFDLRAVALAE